MDKAIVKAAACLAIAAMTIAAVIVDKNGISIFVSIMAIIVIGCIATKD